MHGPDRASCHARPGEVLTELEIESVPTTIPLHAGLADAVDVANGDIDTRFLEGWLARRFPSSAKT